MSTTTDKMIAPHKMTDERTSLNFQLQSFFIIAYGKQYHIRKESIGYFQDFIKETMRQAVG
jgi:hypothetical protein